MGRGRLGSVKVVQCCCREATPPPNTGVVCPSSALWRPQHPTPLLQEGLAGIGLVPSLARNDIDHYSAPPLIYRPPLVHPDVCMLTLADVSTNARPPASRRTPVCLTQDVQISWRPGGTYQSLPVLPYLPRHARV